jgi:hypothetical protein
MSTVPVVDAWKSPSWLSSATPLSPTTRPTHPATSATPEDAAPERRPQGHHRYSRRHQAGADSVVFGDGDKPEAADEENGAGERGVAPLHSGGCRTAAPAGDRVEHGTGQQQADPLHPKGGNPSRP